MPTRETELELRRGQARAERRLTRAITLAAQRLRDRLSETELERALAMGEAWAKVLVDNLDVEDAYQPSGEIIRDVFVRGGKLGAKEVRSG